MNREDIVHYTNSLSSEDFQLLELFIANGWIRQDLIDDLEQAIG